jgi:hypothetical protein
MGYPEDPLTGAWTPARPPTPYPSPDYPWSREEEMAGPCYWDDLLSDLLRPDEPYLHEDLQTSLESGEIPPSPKYVSSPTEHISPLVEGPFPLSFVDWELISSRRSDDPAISTISTI